MIGGGGCAGKLREVCFWELDLLCVETECMNIKDIKAFCTNVYAKCVKLQN